MGVLVAVLRSTLRPMLTRLIHRPAKNISPANWRNSISHCLTLRFSCWSSWSDAFSVVQRNSVPSTHIRCMITVGEQVRRSPFVRRVFWKRVAWPVGQSSP